MAHLTAESTPALIAAPIAEPQFDTLPEDIIAHIYTFAEYRFRHINRRTFRLTLSAKEYFSNEKKLCELKPNSAAYFAFAAFEQINEIFPQNLQSIADGYFINPRPEVFYLLERWYILGRPFSIEVRVEDFYSIKDQYVAEFFYNYVAPDERKTLKMALFAVEHNSYRIINDFLAYEGIGLTPNKKEVIRAMSNLRAIAPTIHLVDYTEILCDDFYEIINARDIKLFKFVALHAKICQFQFTRHLIEAMQNFHPGTTYLLIISPYANISREGRIWLEEMRNPYIYGVREQFMRKLYNASLSESTRFLRIASNAFTHAEIKEFMPYSDYERFKRRMEAELGVIVE